MRLIVFWVLWFRFLRHNLFVRYMLKICELKIKMWISVDFNNFFFTKLFFQYFRSLRFEFFVIFRTEIPRNLEIIKKFNIFRLFSSQVSHSICFLHEELWMSDCEHKFHFTLLSSYEREIERILWSEVAWPSSFRVVQTKAATVVRSPLDILRASVENLFLIGAVYWTGAIENYKGQVTTPMS